MRTRKRNLNFLRNLKNELEEVSKEHNIEIELLKVLIDEMFYDIRKLITSPKMPVITLSSFGTFRPSFKKINFLLDKCVQVMHKLLSSRFKDNNKGILTLNGKIKKYWAVKQRFIAERRGIRTWKCWKDLEEDLEGYQECHRATYQNCLKCRREGEVTQDSTQGM